MKRIVLMVIKCIWIIPIWFLKMFIYGSSDKYTEEKRFLFLKKLTTRVNKAGRVTIESYGTENIPKENGYIIFPNHQGLFDVLAFLEDHPNPFTVVMKKEVVNTILVKQVFNVLKAQSIDREDVRQSMKVIIQMSEDVKMGRNYILFAEGTRSKNGNKLLPFKGGSFKSAIKAKCPIVPTALIDSYKVFDTNSIKKETVKIIYLKPLYYDDYKDMKSTEISSIVKERIEKSIAEYEQSKEEN